jgi:trigger factor
VRYPEIKLANFKKIKPQELKYTVEDKEVAEEVSRILKMYQQQNKDNDNSKVLVMTDEIVKSLNIGLSTKAELEDMLRKQLEHNKKHAAENEQMADIVKQAIELSSIIAPKQLVESELARREADYTGRIEQLGLKLEDFLKTQKTTLEDLKQSWTKESEERIKSELLLAQIAREQKLNVANDEIEKELNAMTDTKLKEQYDNFEGRRYITSLLLQQKSLQWLRDEVGIVPLN